LDKYKSQKISIFFISANDDLVLTSKEAMELSDEERIFTKLDKGVQ